VATHISRLPPPTLVRYPIGHSARPPAGTSASRASSSIPPTCRLKSRCLTNPSNVQLQPMIRRPPLNGKTLPSRPARSCHSSDPWPTHTLCDWVSSASRRVNVAMAPASAHRNGLSSHVVILVCLPGHCSRGRNTSPSSTPTNVHHPLSRQTAELEARTPLLPPARVVPESLPVRWRERVRSSICVSR